jgi:hypothetical protein
MLSELNTLAGQYEDLVKAVASFLPFLSTIFLVFIGLLQWRTSERQRKQDLFEKRYDNLFKNFVDLDFLVFFKAKLDGNIDDKEFNLKIKKISENLIEYRKRLKKYGFLIKKSDYNSLIDLISQGQKKIENFSNLCSDVKFDEASLETYKLILISEKIESILESYLRIETEPTLLDLLGDFIIKFFKFLNPKIITKFKNCKNYIENIWIFTISNFFFWLKKEESKIPKQVRNDEENDSRLVVSE